MGIIWICTNNGSATADKDFFDSSSTIYHNYNNSLGIG